MLLIMFRKEVIQVDIRIKEEKNLMQYRQRTKRGEIPAKKPMYIYFPRAVCELNRMIFYIFYIYRIVSCFVRSSMGLLKEECDPPHDHAKEMHADPKCFEELMGCFAFPHKHFVVKRSSLSLSLSKRSPRAGSVELQVHRLFILFQFRAMKSRRSILISIHCGRIFSFFRLFLYLFFSFRLVGLYEVLL